MYVTAVFSFGKHFYIVTVVSLDILSNVNVMCHQQHRHHSHWQEACKKSLLSYLIVALLICLIVRQKTKSCF